MTLKDLKPGQGGVVTRLIGEGILQHHLSQMGIVPGTYLYVQRSAPMGDPILVQLRGYPICLRKSDAECIEIYSLIGRTM